jgi:hypothetical protein
MPKTIKTNAGYICPYSENVKATELERNFDPASRDLC